MKKVIALSLASACFLGATLASGECKKDSYRVKLMGSAFAGGGWSKGRDGIVDYSSDTAEGVLDQPGQIVTIYGHAKNKDWKPSPESFIFTPTCTGK